MKKGYLFLLLIFVVVFFSCGNERVPDIETTGEVMKIEQAGEIDLDSVPVDQSSSLNSIKPVQNEISYSQSLYTTFTLVGPVVAVLYDYLLR